MALPPSALLCFWYSWLAAVVGSAVHHVLEHFQRPQGLELSIFSPASTELSECYWESLQLVLNNESVSVPQIARCYLCILFVETLGSLVPILLSLLLLRVYVLQRRAVWNIEFGSLWLLDSATMCTTLSIHHAQFLTNEMAGCQKRHNFQVDILWSFSHHMWLSISDQNSFEQTAELQLLQSCVRYRPHNEFCLFYFSWDCRLLIENSASFHNFSSAWIPEDINAAIATCFVLRSTRLSWPTVTHWQWVSALDAVIWSHHRCLLYLKDASAHGIK